MPYGHKQFFQRFSKEHKKTLDMAEIKCYNILVIGVWRRLVARFLGVEEVVGSNPVTPTKKVLR